MSEEHDEGLRKSDRNVLSQVALNQKVVTAQNKLVGRGDGDHRQQRAI
jgi:hypothetical protein